MKNGLRYFLEKIYSRDFVGMLAQMEKYAWADEAFEDEPPIDVAAREMKKEEEMKSLPRTQ